MNIKDYLENIGFELNPFQFTNADQESQYIERYFIAPDYFDDVWGNPYNPVSNIIYAPRGAGKTAQRIMIEKRASVTDNVLTITYVNHDLSRFKSIDEIDSNYHLEYLNRLLLLAFFSRLDSITDFKKAFLFEYNQRQYIYKLARIYLYQTPASFPNQAINSLKTLTDQGLDLWRKFKVPIANIIQQITKNQGHEIDLSTIELDKDLKMTHRDNFVNIVELLNQVGYESIYVLIDKVDEQNLTGNNPEASYRLISDLIKDLELLETPKICFKFFLWDALIPFTSIDARPDRVFPYGLKWTMKKLTAMLDKRVQVYSEGKVSNALSLFEERKLLGRIMIFAQLSPRDCIRICFRTLSEQHKINPNSKVFTKEAVETAIDMFVKEKVRELIPTESTRKYIKSVGDTTFTIQALVNKKVAADSVRARAIINPWTKAQYAKKIGTVKTKIGKKAVNEYSFQDIRVAREACATFTLDQFIEEKVRRCKHCKEIYYRNFEKGERECPTCNTKN